MKTIWKRCLLAAYTVLISLACSIPAAAAMTYSTYWLEKDNDFALPEGEVCLAKGETLTLHTISEETTWTSDNGSTCPWYHYYCVEISSEDSTGVTDGETVYLAGRADNDSRWLIANVENFSCDVGYPHNGRQFVYTYHSQGFCNETDCLAYVSRDEENDESFTWTSWTDESYTTPLDRYTLHTYKFKVRYTFAPQTSDASASDAAGSGSSAVSDSADGSSATRSVTAASGGSSTGSSSSYTLSKGTVITTNNCRYKITGAASAQFLGASAGSTSVGIPGSITCFGTTYKITSIAAGALQGSTSIQKVVIGANVKTIGAKAFKGCTSLTSVTIGKSVSKIGKQAFYGDSKLKKITFKTKKLTKSAVGAKAFKGISSKAVCKVPASCRKKYKTILKAKGAGSKVTVK